MSDSNAGIREMAAGNEDFVLKIGVTGIGPVFGGAPVTPKSASLPKYGDFSVSGCQMMTENNNDR